MIREFNRPSPDRPIADSMSFFSHLECSVPCGAPALDPRKPHHLCSCGAPLLARYDLARARAWRRESLEGREQNLWRYRETLPPLAGAEPVTMGERHPTPIHDRLPGAQ